MTTTDNSKTIYVLGISCYYHDSAAAIIKDGKIIAAAQEERFSRKKHDTSFPLKAINYCLKEAKITINEIDHIGFYEKPLIKFERLLSQHLETFPKSIKTFLKSTPSWLTTKLRIIKTIRKKLKYKKDVHFINHHLSHASTFLISPYNKAAIVTLDGVGEWTTTSWGIGEETNITLKQEIHFPTSLGLLYSTITGYLGFSVNNSEYKVMGLAPYGNMNRETNQYYKKLLRVIDIKPDGSYQLRMNYFIYHYGDRMHSQELCNLLGMARKPEEELTQRHKDIASAVQLVYEDALFRILNYVHKKTKLDNLIIGGGCALNSVANGKIISNTPFTNVWTQPDPGDAGTSIGAAAFVYHNILGKKRTHHLEHAYLGPEYTNNEIKNYLDKEKIVYTELKNEEEIIITTAKLVTQNNVIGWFQGRMEWGPRALGTRSIISNATNPDMKEIINTKVKHREHFRPFAPSVCEEDANTYFTCDEPLQEIASFMLMVYPVQKQYREKIPAVTHVDGSGRLQTVSKKTNLLYYSLIKKIGEKTGIPIIINTSFNVRGEPIVCSPKDAYLCMMGTGIDYLVIGKYLIKRDENLKDAWDSEKTAVD